MPPCSLIKDNLFYLLLLSPFLSCPYNALTSQYRNVRRSGHAEQTSAMVEFESGPDSEPPTSRRWQSKAVRILCMSGASEDVKWERVLWKSQPFPDNYVPRSFLSELRKNSMYSYCPEEGVAHLSSLANRPPYAYAPVVLASCAVTQHICTISIFLATFIHINTGHLDPRVLVWVSIGCSVGGYLIWEALSREAPETRKEQRMSFSLYLGP
jgi:hypothetical protein